MVSSAQPRRSTTSHSRSVPFSWSVRVKIPCTAASPSNNAPMRASSKATHTGKPLATACRAVRTTIGTPAISRSGLAGRRVEP